MDFGLKGKRALISGSTAGIGFATACALVAEGASVVVNGRTAVRVEQAVRDIEARVAGAQVRGVVADLGHAAGCAALISQVPEVDILVNSLGIFGFKSFESLTDEDWLHYFEVNVLSGVRLSRHYVDAMRRQGWGRIVFVSSESGVQVPPGMLPYAMSKTCQLTIARGLAESLAGTGVTVNSVLPGPTASEGVCGFVKEMARTRQANIETVGKEFFKQVGPTSIIRRFAEPEEVAAMIAYVCSARASATTGAALRVDGGIVRSVL